MYHLFCFLKDCISKKTFSYQENSICFFEIVYYSLLFAKACFSKKAGHLSKLGETSKRFNFHIFISNRCRARCAIHSAACQHAPTPPPPPNHQHVPEREGDPERAARTAAGGRAAAEDERQRPHGHQAAQQLRLRPAGRGRRRRLQTAQPEDVRPGLRRVPAPAEARVAHGQHQVAAAELRAEAQVDREECQG